MPGNSITPINGSAVVRVAPERRRQRELARRTQEIRDEYRLNQLRVRGTKAVTEVAIESFAELYDYMRDVALGDAILMQGCGELVAGALLEFKKIQRNGGSDIGGL